MAVIGVVGGTGKLGAALAGRWAKAGHEVLIGSRSAESAAATAGELSERFSVPVGAGTNLDVAGRAGIVVCAVPWSAQEERLREIREAVQDKIVIDTTVPLVPPKVMRVQLPPEGSAALKAQAVLGEGVRLVSAFHNVAAPALWSEDDFLDEDVIVVGDSLEGKQVAIDLAASVTGRPGIDGGKLRLARVLEPFTAVLISINRKYKTHSGIRVTGL